MGTIKMDVPLPESVKVTGYWSYETADVWDITAVLPRDWFYAFERSLAHMARRPIDDKVVYQLTVEKVVMVADVYDEVLYVKFAGDSIIFGRDMSVRL